MPHDEIKKYLEYIFNIDIDISTAKSELAYLYENMHTNETEKRIMELEGAIAQKTIDKCNFVIMCDSLTDTIHRSIMIRRYILRQKWRDIAKEVHLSERGATINHTKAIKEFTEIYKKA